MDGATYDRSGRLSLEAWTIEPNEAVVDPMLDYFASVGGVIGGGIRRMDTIGATPVAVRVVLNEWFRFDLPGTYELSAIPQRVTRGSCSLIEPLGRLGLL